MLRYTPTDIQLIEKENYYKIKYSGKHTFLNLIVFLPHIKCTLDHESNSLIIAIHDPESSRLLKEIDTYFNDILPNYQPFSRYVGGDTTIHFSLNPFVLEFHKNQPRYAHIRFKCVRKIANNYNQPLLYIA
jgi:hypothetical protein